ncbi:unnamed protein product [Peniophora sp. CBMAI 1063]|nr:unnamed protein product [Peniophora sp. CBMAI 1063]
MFTLPIGIVTIALTVKNDASIGRIPFYFGWTLDHTNWQPESFSFADIISAGPLNLANFRFTYWTSPVLAFVIFGLFGITLEARVSYWRIICTVGGWFGWHPTPRTRRARSAPGDIEVGERPAQNSMSLGLESNPSFINPNARVQDRGEEGAGSAMNEMAEGSEGKDAADEVRRATGDTLHVDAERSTRSHGSRQDGIEDVMDIA